MAGFLALFKGGPMNLQVLTVYADPGPKGFSGPPQRPASWQEFYRPITNQHGLRTGRVGVFVYKLEKRASLDDLWSYVYKNYGEAHEDV